MRRKASILRVAVRYLEAARGPKWVEAAILQLIKSRKVRGLNRSYDLKTMDRRTGNVWKWHSKEHNAITLEIEKTRQEIIIYQNEEWRDVALDEITDLLENSPEEAYEYYGDLISLDMRAGDVRAFASDEAQSVRENLTDELESGSMDAEDLIDMANLNDQWNEAEELLAEYEKYPEYDYRAGYAADARQTLFELPKTAIEEIAAEKYKEVEEALNRYPYEYLTDDLGFSHESAVDALIIDVERSLTSISASTNMEPSHGGESFNLSPNHTVFVL